MVYHLALERKELCMCTTKAWAWINKDSIVVAAFAPGTSLEETLPIYGIGQIVEVTHENSPVSIGDKWDGNKFVKVGIDG